MQHDVAKLFFGQVVEQAQQARLMSSEHFSVDGTLIDAWASLKSFQPKDAAAERKARNRKKAERRGRGGKGPKSGGGRNAEVSFHGQSAATKRTNRRRTRKLGWLARVETERLVFPTPATRSWRIAAGCSSTSASAKPTARPSGTTRSSC
jgi:hypothetical protein